jgi:hypothetical protein
MRKNNLTKPILIILTFKSLLAVASPSKTCSINYKKGSVERLRIPLGAASTIRFQEDVSFAHLGLASDYSVVAAQGFRNMMIISPLRSTTRETSFTVMVGRKGTPIALWLVPDHSERACTFIDVKKGI